MTDFRPDGFVTTTRGLDRDHPAMRLFEKSKQLGIWNPSVVDFTQDKVDFQSLSLTEQDVLMRLIAIFLAGEEAVTLDLLPLIMVIAKEGRLEEEMFLTSFLWEEAKHTDFFQRFMQEVIGEQIGDVKRYYTPSYHAIFSEALPQALDNLIVDTSPQAQLVASITYNMIVEGVLAETGYEFVYRALYENNIMPGLVTGIHKLQQDESRHIAYGVFLISRLVAENNDLWDVAETTMNGLLPAAIGVVHEAFASYDPIPFDLVMDEFINYALMQFQKRLGRIQKARSLSLSDVYATAHSAMAIEDI